MRWYVYLMALGLTLTLTGCLGRSPEPIVVTNTSVIKNNIPIQARPKQLVLSDVKWYVVSEKNLDEFMVKFKEDEGLLAFIAVSPQGYENLAMDIADMRRYILQQKDIILYYEQSLVPPVKEVPND